MTPGEVGRMLAALQRIEALLETLTSLTAASVDGEATMTEVPALPLRANPTLGWRRPPLRANGTQGHR